MTARSGEPRAPFDRLVEGRGIQVGHFDERLRLLPGEPVVSSQPGELRRAA